jgi:methionyl aminopeptidase
MSIESKAELKAMELAGKVTRATLDAMKKAVKPGITTGELDRIGAGVMRDYGAKSAPKLVYGFPGENCISVNEEIVHGIPGSRKLLNGDLVKLDVTVEINGFMTDACETVGVGTINQQSRRLIDCCCEAFRDGLAAVRPRVRAFEVGRAPYKDRSRERGIRLCVT